MKRLAKIFDREQVGLDGWQCTVFVLAVMSLVMTPYMATDASIPVTVPSFLMIFGLWLMVLDFAYVAASIVFTRGHWRQYCVYLLLDFSILLLFFCSLPSLARAKE